MRRIVLIVAGLFAAAVQGACPVRVASVEAGFEAERAGLRADDCLLRWRQGEGKSRPLTDPLDLIYVENEQAPRGDLRLQRRRGQDTRWITMPTAQFSMIAWPAMPPALTAQVRQWHAGLAEREATALPRTPELAELPPRRRAALHLAAAQALELRSAKLQDAELAAAIDLLDAPEHARPRASLLLRRCRANQLAFQLERATPICGEAARALAGPGFEVTRLRLQSTQADLLRMQSRAAEAESATRELLAAALGLVPESLLTAEAHFKLGSILHVQSRLVESLAEIDAAQALIGRIGSAPYFASILSSQRGLTLKASGDFDAAEEALAHTVRLRESFAPDSMDLARALNNLATLSIDRDALIEAEPLVQRALAIKRKRGVSPRDVASSLAGLAHIALARGRLAEADRYSAEALAAERSTGVESEELSARLLGRARVEIRLARHEQAQQSIDEARRISESRLAGGSRAALPWLYQAELDLARARPAAALAAAQRAEAMQRASGGQDRDLPFALQILGDAHSELGQHQAARRAYAEAVSLRRPTVPDSLELANSLWHLGRSERALDDLPRAREHLCEAVAVLDRQRWRWSGERNDHFELNRRTAPIYRDCARAELEAGHPQAAFDRLEHGRARVLLEQMGLRRTELLDSLPDDLRRTLREAASDPTRRPAAQQAVAAIAPAIAATLYPQPPGYPELRAQMEPGSAALGFVRFEDGRSYLLLVLPEATEPRFVPVPASAARLDQAVAELLRLAADPHSSTQAIDILARQLDRWLIAPVASELAGRTHLLLVPDEHLAVLPFALLRDANGRHLFERVALRQAASFASAALAARQPAAHGTQLLLVAEPRGRALQIATADPTRGGGPIDLPELPGVVQEAGALAGLYAGALDLRMGPAATVEGLYAGLAQARWLHVAAHGLLDTAQPMESALVLAAPQDGSGAGLWSALEMLRGPAIPADLVSVSACSLGGGRALAGEGLLGVRHALRAAGAREVLSSLWDVSDHAGAELMVQFHRALRAGARSDQALRLAQQRLAGSQPSAAAVRGVGGVARAATPLAPHPYYWAGFVLDGVW